MDWRDLGYSYRQMNVIKSRLLDPGFLRAVAGARDRFTPYERLGKKHFERTELRLGDILRSAQLRAALRNVLDTRLIFSNNVEGQYLTGAAVGMDPKTGVFDLIVNPNLGDWDIVWDILHESKHLLDHTRGVKVTPTGVPLSSAGFAVYHALASERRAEAFAWKWFDWAAGKKRHR